MTKNQILENLFNSESVNILIMNISHGHHLHDELKQELFLVLLQMSEKKIQDAHTGKWMNYLIINILTKMWKSNTSPFYKKFRIENVQLIDNMPFYDQPPNYSEEQIKTILEMIDDLPLVKKELIYMRYKMGDYDKHFGKKRDNFCKKNIYSYRKMEKKLKIGDVSIDHNTIQKYHQQTIAEIKKTYKDDI